jgi:predicted metal-dependent phosphoesterase TrpH
LFAESEERRMKKFYLSLLLVNVALSGVGLGQVTKHQTRTRTSIRIPDVTPYKTLKCDLHIHTVFSDGSVWPDVRPEEAWREGLHAIALTDHIEYQPHKEDLPSNFNRSFEIAKPRGDLLQVTVIRGSEVTRDMPPGHINAIFIQDADGLDTENWQDAIRTASDQGAFIFWNHPGWDAQLIEGSIKWFPEHTELVSAGMLHGIEVVNERQYYPEAHRWAIEKQLTMLSNSDIHAPVNMDFHVYHGDHRPITLVFAKDESPAAIKEALFARRTALYAQNMLIGNEVFLKPIFNRSIAILNREVTIRGRRRALVQITNYSDVTFHLSGGGDLDGISVPEDLSLKAGKTVLLEVDGTEENRSDRKEFQIPYTVDNLLVAPEKGLPVMLAVEVKFEPEPPAN